MSDRHHPTWAEIKTQFIDDALYDLLAEAYAPVPRDREAERARCEATIPGYALERDCGAIP